MGRRLSPTTEDYLEAVGQLCREGGRARGRDLSERLCVHKSTVTAMLRRLSSEGLVNYCAYGSTTLTERGQRIADAVCARHEALRRFLHGVLNLSVGEADVLACRLEHAVGSDVVARLGRLADFLGDRGLLGEALRESLEGK